MSKKIVHYTKNVITIDSDSAKKYAELTSKINKLKKELEPLESELKKEIADIMNTINITKMSSNGINATLVKAYVQNKFDTTRLKEEDIDTYNKYLKAVEVKETLKLSLDN